MLWWSVSLESSTQRGRGSSVALPREASLYPNIEYINLLLYCIGDVCTKSIQERIFFNFIGEVKTKKQIGIPFKVLICSFCLFLGRFIRNWIFEYHWISKFTQNSRVREQLEQLNRIQASQTYHLTSIFHLKFVPFPRGLWLSDFSCVMSGKPGGDFQAVTTWLGGVTAPAGNSAINGGDCKGRQSKMSETFMF